MAYTNRLGEIYVDFNAPDWVRSIRYTPEKVPPTENTPTSWQYSFVKARTVKNIPAEEKAKWNQIAPLRNKLLALEKDIETEVRIYNENLTEFSKLSGQPMTELSAQGILKASISALMASPLSVPNVSSIEGIAALAGKVIFPLIPMFGDAIGKLVGMIAGLFSNKKKKMEHFARQLEYRANNIRGYQTKYMQVAAQLRWLLEGTPNYKTMMQDALTSARQAQKAAVDSKQSIEQRASSLRLQEIARIRQMNQNRVHLPTNNDFL